MAADAHFATVAFVTGLVLGHRSAAAAALATLCCAVVFGRPGRTGRPGRRQRRDAASGQHSRGRHDGKGAAAVRIVIGDGARAARELRQVRPQLLLAPTRPADPLASLTERERDVLSLLAEGRPDAAMARQLRATQRTVETHVRHIFAKRGLIDSEGDNRRVLAVLTYLRSRSSGMNGAPDRL